MPFLVKMLRRLPVKENLNDIATFINRELLPVLQELKDVLGGSGGAGATGVTGATGLAGATGLQGQDGADGPEGVQGFQGAQGAQGLQGFMGLSGSDGLDGNDGLVLAPTPRRNPTAFVVHWTGAIIDFALPAGFQAGDSLVAILTGDTVLHSIVPPDVICDMYVCLGGQSGGDWKLTIKYQGSGTAANKIFTPGFEFGDPLPYDYIMQSNQENVHLLYLQVGNALVPGGGWLVAAGTAAQAVIGDVSIRPGLGGTRTATLTDAGIAKARAGFIGLPGADGVDGTDGFPGLPGATGATGATGSQGIQGFAGSDGADGENGISFTPGPTGANGVDGAAGAMGLAGADGVDGADGFPGLPGATGATGATGNDGAPGLMGLMGSDGTDGSDGVSFIPGPQGIQGPAGAQFTAFGADGADGADGYQSFIPGPTGAQGPAGAQFTAFGADGADGADGSPSFVVGPAGAPGATGATGAVFGSSPTNASLTASDLNDLAITGFDVLRFTAGSATNALTGMVASAVNQVVLIQNTDTSLPAIIRHASTGSSTTNRFRLSDNKDLRIPPNGSLLARYDASLRWLALVDAQSYADDGLTATDATGGGADFAVADGVAELVESGSAGVAAFSGFARAGGNFAGDKLIVRFTGSAVMTLSHLVASTAINQISCPYGIDANLGTGGVATLRHNGTNWIVIHATPQLEVSINGATKAMVGFIDYSTGAGMSITGTPASGAMAFVADTVRPGQLGLDTGTDSTGVLTAALRGYRPGLTGITTLPTATNATTNLSTGVYTIPANTLVAGSRYELFLAWVWNHNSGTTTPTTTFELLVAGAVVAAYTRVTTPIATPSNYTGSERTYFRCVTNGSSGTYIMTNLHLDNVQTFGFNSDANSIVTTPTTINTTVTRTLEARIRMTTGVASETLTLTEAYISRLL